MGRCCAVNGCYSGRKSRKSAGKVALFQMPKDVELQSKWSSALGQELRATSFVCEKHFSTEDVIKIDREVMRDGSIFEYEYQKVHLKRKAEPKSNIKNSNDDNNSLPSDNKLPNTSDIIDNAIIGDCTFDTVETVLTIIEPVNTNFLDSLNTAAENDNSLSNTNFLDGVNTATENDNSLSNTNFIDGVNTAIENDNSLSNTNFLDGVNTATENDNSLSNTNFIDGINTAIENDNSLSNTSDILDHTLIDDSCINLVETVLTVIEPVNTNFLDSANTATGNDNLPVINEPEELSFHSIIEILETKPLRRNWSWTVIKKSIISLSYISPKLELVCHVKIDMDLKVTVTNAKTKIDVDMHGNISSFACVWQLLKSLENSIFCSGTGYDDKICSVTCTGILLPEERYKRRVVEYRCITCRKLRCLIQKRKTETTKNEALWKNFKHRSSRKLNQFVHTDKNLKQQLLDIKNQCAEIKEEVLSEKIADLPALQQKTVINCLLAAKAKSATQRRYTFKWANECLLMSTKSSALYEHIRKKNILPLPCKDTLIKYTQKQKGRDKNSKD